MFREPVPQQYLSKQHYDHRYTRFRVMKVRRPCLRAVTAQNMIEIALLALLRALFTEDVPDYQAAQIADCVKKHRDRDMRSLYKDEPHTKNEARQQSD